MFDGFYILGYGEDFFSKVKFEPRFFSDLNLDVIVNQIAAKRKSYNFQKYFYRLPENKEIAVGRAEILRAVCHSGFRDALIAFSDCMRAARSYKERFGHVQTSIQKERLLLDCAGEYIAALKHLEKALQRKEAVGSSFLQRLQGSLSEYMNGEGFAEFASETERLLGEFEKLRVRVIIDEDKLKISVEEETERYIGRLKALFPEGEQGQEAVLNPFQDREEIGEMEIAILELLQKGSEELFTDLYRYFEQYRSPEEILEPPVLVLEQQLQFYIASSLFLEELEQKPYPCAYPEFQENMRSVEVGEGFDLALFIKKYSAENPIVCNGLSMSEKEQFLVVTGPNQGGKTTYARSIGQIVYFSMMGLPAPCRFVKLPFFQGILTHFSVEESLETGRGKLKEELVRLEPMMKKEEKNCFVVINELFTTAATYDACIMGKRVMEHFMRQDCKGIYVTHIQELAVEGTIGDDKHQIVSLVACVDEKNPRQRTYKIRRKRAEGIGYAYGLAEKYHLTYQDLKGRLQQRVNAVRLQKGEADEK